MSGPLTAGALIILIAFAQAIREDLAQGRYLRGLYPRRRREFFEASTDETDLAEWGTELQDIGGWS